MSKKAKKRKMHKIKLIDNLYTYKTGKTIREKLATKRGCDGEYRIKKIKRGVELLLCIRKKPGKRGGKTKALALLRTDTRIKQYKKHYQKTEPKLLKALNIKEMAAKGRRKCKKGTKKGRKKTK